MTDKRFIETLKNIKKYCEGISCNECKLSRTDLHLCMFDKLGSKLGKLPIDWEIEEIERIIKDE